MIVGRNKELKTISIIAANQTIQHQENLKILGITLSASLKFNSHINEGKRSLTKEMFNKMSILRNVKPHVDMKTLASIISKHLTPTSPQSKELRSPLLTTKEFKKLLKEHILITHKLPIHNNN